MADYRNSVGESELFGRISGGFAKVMESVNRGRYGWDANGTVVCESEGEGVPVEEADGGKVSISVIRHIFMDDHRGDCDRDEEFVEDREFDDPQEALDYAFEKYRVDKFDKWHGTAKSMINRFTMEQYEVIPHGFKFAEGEGGTLCVAVDEGVVGSAVGAGLGACVGGPVGAVAGGALGQAVTGESSEVCEDGEDGQDGQPAGGQPEGGETDGGETEGQDAGGQAEGGAEGQDDRVFYNITAKKKEMKVMQKFVSLKEVAHKFAEGYECPVAWYSMADDGSYVRICLAHCSWDDLTPDDVAKLFGFRYAALCEVKGKQGAMLFQRDYDLQSWKTLKTWERNGKTSDDAAASEAPQQVNGSVNECGRREKTGTYRKVDEGVVGSAVGAGLGACVGGPVGAVAGGALGQAVTGESEGEDEGDGAYECDFPAWALNYVVNGERGSVSPEERRMIEDWKAQVREAGFRMGMASFGEDEHFCRRPAFGEPCQCVTVVIPAR